LHYRVRKQFRQFPDHVSHGCLLLQPKRDSPTGYLVRRVRFNSVIDHNDQRRVLLAEIENLTDGQRFVDLESVLTQILAEAWQLSSEVDQLAHEQRLSRFSSLLPSINQDTARMFVSPPSHQLVGQHLSFGENPASISRKRIVDQEASNMRKYRSFYSLDH
jgi:hypothetical protein